MTLSDEQIKHITESITGWLDQHEASLLYHLALAIPENGVIVEIGSYHGRSTTVLALGAKERNGTVYAVDPYEGTMDGRKVDLHDRDHLRYALTENGVLGSVEIITGHSVDTAKTWYKPIDLIFIDGSHVYEDVKADLAAWSKYGLDKIALHDYTPNWPGVPLAVDEFVRAGEWRIVEQQDATVVLERVTKS